MCEIGWTEKDKYCTISLLCEIENIQQLMTHRYREQTSGYYWGEQRAEGQHRGRGVKGIDYYV